MRVATARRAPRSCDPLRYHLRRRSNARSLGWRAGAGAHPAGLFRQDEVAISLFVACELAAGVALASRADEERARVQAACANLRLVYPDQGFADSYGGILGALKRAGRTVGTMDILIATAAIQEKARLVTRNEKDFVAIPGVELIPY